MKRGAFFFQSVIHLCLEYCIIFPLLCLLVRNLPLSQMITLLVIGFCCGVLGILFKCLGTYRALLITGIFLCAIAAVWLGNSLSRHYRVLRFLLFSAYFCFAFFRGWQHGRNTWNRVLSSKALVVLLFLDLAAVLANLLIPALSDPHQLIAWSCIPAILVALFSMNHINRLDLAESQRAEQNVITITGRLAPLSLRLLFLLLPAGVLIALLLSRISWVPHIPKLNMPQSLISLPGSIAAFLSEGIVRLFQWLFRFAEVGEPGPDPPPPLPVAVEEVEVSSAWVYIMQGLYLLLLITVALVLLFRLVRRLLSRRRGTGNNRNELTGGAYEDQYESLLDLKGLPGRVLERLRKGFGIERVPWVMLRSERDRVRYLYRLMILNAEKKGYRKPDSDTPREALSHIVETTPHVAGAYGRLVTLYEQVCYGEEDPPPGSTEKIRRTIVKEF